MSAIFKISKLPYVNKNHLILMKFCTQQQIWNSMTVT